jgi:hypothetical protein
VAGGIITLGEVAGRTVVLTLACRVCHRHGRLRTDRLLREHGPATPMPDLLRVLAGDCPRLDNAGFTDEGIASAVRYTTRWENIWRISAVHRTGSLYLGRIAIAGRILWTEIRLDERR